MPQSTRRWITDKVEALRNAPQLPFHDLLDPATVAPVLEEDHVTFRERVFTPLVTLWTFLSQVLSPDPGRTHQSCKSLPSKGLRLSVRLTTDRKLFADKDLRLWCVS